MVMNPHSIRDAASEILQARPTALSDPASSVMTLQLRNFEAFARAQQATMEGNKAVAEQQLEFIISAASRALKGFQEIMAEADWSASLRLRFAVLKASLQESTGNGNTLAEMSARSNAQATQIIYDRVFDALDETQAVLESTLAAFPAPHSPGSARRTSLR